MTSTIKLSLNFAIQQIAKYYGIPVFIMGVSGGFLNIIVFLSLKTFRQSSCAFYLMVMSAFDLGRFFSSTLAGIIWSGFGIDWTLSSLFYCKIKVFLYSTCSLNSMTCLCLAIIDQYFATCSRPHWQQWCNIKLAYRLTAVFSIIWILHGIPYFVFYDHIILSPTNKTICQITNNIFIKYHTYGYFLTLNNLLPLITFVFGLMAYHNARHIGHRTVPLVRRELDKQLTVMVLVQVLINFCTFLPYSIECMYALTIINAKDPIFTAKIELTSMITYYFSILHYTSPFYTYVCVSKRFRRQLKHILFEIHFKRCRRPTKIAPNQEAIGH